MHSKITDDVDDWLNLLDLDSIAEPSDKLHECEYFLELAVRENNKDKFRWLISAFFGSAYSYFEIHALRAYQSFHNPETGDAIVNGGALEVLRNYVRVFQDIKRPNYVKTAGQHKITKELYNLRKGNTHHYPLSIMQNECKSPDGYSFGSLSGKGVPALDFCRKVMSLIKEVESELHPHY